MKQDWTQALRLAKKTYHLMTAQEKTGIGFDKVAAEQLCERIKAMQLEIVERIEPQLPPRKLKKGEQDALTLPKKPYLKDGTFSEVMLRFMEKHQGVVIDPNTVEFYGKAYLVTGGLQLTGEMPMKLNNQEDIKDWLLSQGWQPTLWNYKKDARNKPLRVNGKLVKTAPKLQDSGRICPNLEEMKSGELVPGIVRWLSLRNRLSVLEGWLAHPRLGIDNRLPPGSSGITNTCRQKHTVVVNVPKAQDGVILGREMRSLFIAQEGNVLVGGDACALEACMEGHYTYRYDGGKYARELLDGDVHSKNAALFFPEVQSTDIDFKKYRSKSKNGKYALTYGCSPPKLAATLQCDKSQSEALYESFWNGNPSLKDLRDNVTRFWETHGDKKWVLGLDGRKIFSRSKHSLINVIFQSAGAICMDMAGVFLDKKFGGIKIENGVPVYQVGEYVIKRVGYFHDEYIFECKPEIANWVGEQICEAIKKAGEYFKLNVPLKGEYKIGKSWAETH